MAFERFDSYSENNCNVYVAVIHPRTGHARFVFLRMYVHLNLQLSTCVHIYTIVLICHFRLCGWNRGNNIK